MLKWYEQVKMEPGKYYVSNRIRLARNWSEYHFPRRLRNDEASEMVQRMRDALQELPIQQHEECARLSPHGSSGDSPYGHARAPCTEFQYFRAKGAGGTVFIGE